MNLRNVSVEMMEYEYKIFIMVFVNFHKAGTNFRKERGTMLIVPFA